MGYKIVISIIAAFTIAFILSCGDNGPTGSGTGTDTTQITVTLDIPLNLRVDSLEIVDTVHTCQIIIIDTTTDDTIVYDTTRDTILARFVAFWDTVPRATHYFVYVLDSVGNFIRFYTVSDTMPDGRPVNRWLISGLKPNDTYRFNIAAGKDTAVVDTVIGNVTLYDTLQFIGEKTNYYSVPLFLPLPPENITVNTIGQTSLVSWTPVSGIGILGYTVYLYDDIGAVKDSQQVDSLTASHNFTSLEKDKAYKVNIITRAMIGHSVICSTFAYDVSTLQDTGFKLPYVYVSTYEKPDDGNAASTVLGSGYMVGIKGGIFAMGDIWGDITGGNNGKPVHEVILSSFYLAKYEISDSLFMRFLNGIDTGPSADTVEYHFIEDSTDTVNTFVYKGDTLLRQDSLLFIILDTVNGTFIVAPGKESYPVSGVTWKGAALFCNWLSEEDNLNKCYASDWSLIPSAEGYRLPTEAEFEYAHSAAFTGKKQRYPWGYNHDPGQYASLTTGFDIVGSYKSYFGFHNLSGNVLEWCNDKSDYVTGKDSSQYYKECLDSGIVYNPLGPQTGSKHVLRGGSYLLSGEKNSSAWRHNNPSVNFTSYGFRVARNGKLLREF